MLKTKFLFALGALLSFALTVSSARAIPGLGDSVGISPFWTYKTIETDHFRISFPQELQDTAQKTAGYLEEAHRLLSPALYWTAAYRVNVVILDNQDSENGLTSATLRLGLVLFVTPPDNWNSTAYYDNWLRLLCLHEYTHFLNMDATRGLYKAARYLFGDLLLPNSLWASWMLEGLAVFDETRYTHSGRGRSPYYDMVLRAAVLENVLDSRRFITLDKVNGHNPWYPGGETAYLFGYELMNQVNLASGEDALGVMSKSSSERIPFFINGNLENITGETWYTSWDKFVRNSRTHAGEQLKTIRSQPVSAFKRLTQDGYDLYGPSISSDGKWIAYTHFGLHDLSGLYLRNRKTGETTRLMDKDGGVSLAFTRDSHYLFQSRLHRIRTYTLYSDLEILDLESGRTQWLTWNQRARDPALSPDNHWIAYTTTSSSTTNLSISELKYNGNDFALGSTRVLFQGAKFDRVSTPRFSPDGKKVVFSWHRNGTPGEDIVSVDVEANQAHVLVRDSSLNRFPTLDDDGTLYYVSNRSGVDNLYRADGALLSNFETGVAFPVFSPSLEKGTYLATVFSTRGWDLAQVQLPTAPYNAPALRVKAPSAPQPDDKSVDHAEDNTYPVKDYSVWPTILPRSWAPLIAATGQGIVAGGSILGFDQVDRHRYAIVGDYDTYVKKGDVYAVYDNRLLGPTLEAAASLYTSFEQSNGGTLIAYGRKENYSLSAYYTFAYTYSSLTPRISYGFQREHGYVVTGAGPDFNYFNTTPVPNADATLIYANGESSRLAITTERGGTHLAGARVYMNSGDNVWKGLLTDRESMELGESHVVFSPTLKGSWVSHTSNYSPANVLVQGRYSGVLNAIAADDYDHLGIHGYPLQAFYTRGAAVGSGFLKFPLWRIFAGPGTDPLFFQNLYGFGFGEATYFPVKDQSAAVLPSAGGGLTLSLDVAQYVPLSMTVEYDKGFRAPQGGKGEVFFQLGVQSSLF